MVKVLMGLKWRRLLGHCVSHEAVLCFVQDVHCSGAGVEPFRAVILLNRAEPPAWIFALRRSRRRRACFWFSVSPTGAVLGSSIVVYVSGDGTKSGWPWRLWDAVSCQAHGARAS